VGWGRKSKKVPVHNDPRRIKIKVEKGKNGEEKKRIIRT